MKPLFAGPPAAQTACLQPVWLLGLEMLCTCCVAALAVFRVVGARHRDCNEPLRAEEGDRMALVQFAVSSLSADTHLPTI